MTKQKIWTPQVVYYFTKEDEILLQFHKQAGCFQRWKFISAKLKEKGIFKTQFQCRDRFINYLDPDLKLGKLNRPQIIKLFECYDQHGPRWSFFQTKIKGRSQNTLKNQFYSTLRSLLRLLIKVGGKRNLYNWKFQPINYSSKLLSDLYEGRRSFYSYKNFFRSCLKNIGCCIEKQTLQNYLSTVDPQILKQFYQVIFKQMGRNQLRITRNSNINSESKIQQIQNVRREANNERRQFEGSKGKQNRKQENLNNQMMIMGLVVMQNPQQNFRNSQMNMANIMKIGDYNNSYNYNYNCPFNLLSPQRGYNGLNFYYYYS